MRTHTRHVFMCVGPRCTENGTRAQAIFEYMGTQIDARPELRVKRTRTHCMVACRAEGPLMVVYPEGTWYNKLDEAAIDRIVEVHLVQGEEVPELIFHRLGSGDVEEQDA